MSIYNDGFGCLYHRNFDGPIICFILGLSPRILHLLILKSHVSKYLLHCEVEDALKPQLERVVYRHGDLPRYVLDLVLPREQIFWV